MISKTDRTSPLSREDEVAMVARAKQGDIDARNRIFESNVGLVYKIAGVYVKRYGGDIHDYVQQGVVALFRAFEKFEPKRGLRFMTYAQTWVSAYIVRYAKLEKSIVSSCAFSSRQVRVVYADYSLDTMLLESADSNGETFLSRQVDSGPTPEEALLTKRQRTEIDAAASCLTDRERSIVYRRHLNGETTLAELGREFRVSREAIRQAELKALRKIKTALIEAGHHA